MLYDHLLFQSKPRDITAPASPKTRRVPYSLLTDRRGGSYVEYVILIAVIVLGLVGALRLFGRAISEQAEREGKAILSMTVREGSASSSNAGDHSGAGTEMCRGLSGCALQHGKDALRSLGSSIVETTSGLGTVASSTWKGIKDDLGGVLDGMRTNAKYVRQAQEWLEHRVDVQRAMGETATQRLVDKVEGIPVLEQGVKTYAWMGKQANQVNAAIDKFVIRAVGGAVGVVADPVDTAIGLATMAEHTTLGGPVNPLRIAHGLYNAATTDATLAGELKRALNPIEAAKDDSAFWMETGRAFIKPCKDAWDQGNYTEGVGCAALEVGSFVAGAGEAKAATKAASVVGKTADVVQLGEEARIARAAKLGEEAKLGREATVAEEATVEVTVAGEAKLADNVPNAAGAADKTADVTNAARGGTYKLRDPETGQVRRTGRTNDLERREGEHGRHPETRDLTFEVDRRTDSYAAQRGREQRIYEQHPEADLNRKRPISPINPRIEEYLREGDKL